LNHLHEQLRRACRVQLVPLLLGSGVIAPLLSQHPAAAQAPAATANEANNTAAANTAARAAATQSLLARAKAAIDAKQYADAVELYRRVRVNAQPLPEFQPRVAAQRQTLTQLGFDAALLDMPPSAPPHATSARCRRWLLMGDSGRS
jgi:hypothetical protein